MILITPVDMSHQKTMQYLGHKNNIIKDRPQSLDYTLPLFVDIPTVADGQNDDSVVFHIKCHAVVSDAETILATMKMLEAFGKGKRVRRSEKILKFSDNEVLGVRR